MEPLAPSLGAQAAELSALIHACIAKDKTVNIFRCLMEAEKILHYLQPPDCSQRPGCFTIGCTPPFTAKGNHFAEEVAKMAAQQPCVFQSLHLCFKFLGPYL